MCGIFGVIGKNFDQEIDACLEQIKHRGPDDTGQYKDANIVLGFNRLSIVDLSEKGNQPMSNEDKTIWLVCNGEIYNHLAIRKLLSKKHRFSSNSDSEVLIHGYEEWGIDELLQKVNGMFAFCIYEKGKNISFLARDRIGKKPLYYYLFDKHLSFSSEVKAFSALQEFDFEIERESFELFMGFPYLPNNSKTIIKNIHKVPPGYYLKISEPIKIEPHQYWELPQKRVKKTFESAKKEVESVLIDAVSKRLEADVPVGILLSGGLDSSLITSIAAKNSRRKIKTISISFENSCIDESRYARLVADHCGTEHLELRLKIEDAYESFKQNIWIYDDLSTVDSGLFSEYLLAQKIKENGIKVVLVGEGADEIFAGYTWFQFAKYPFKLFPEYLKVAGYFYAFTRNLPSLSFLKSSLALFRKMSETKGSFFQKIQQYEIRYSLPNHYCMKVDKGTSAASIEARAPFMDYRLIEMACKLKQDFFLKDKFFKPWKADEKFILRKIAEQYLPKEIFERKKKGGMLPLQDILRIGLEKDGDKIVNNELLTAYFGKGFLEKLINRKPKFKIFEWRREWILWKCLVFALWFEHNSIIINNK